MYLNRTHNRGAKSENRAAAAALISVLAMFVASLLAQAASAQPITVTGLQGYFRTGAPGAANPTAGQSPSGNPSGWTPLDPNGQNNPTISIPPNGVLFIGVENAHYENRKKTFTLKMKVNPSGKAKHLVNNRVNSDRRPQYGGYDSAGNAVGSRGAAGSNGAWVTVKAVFDPQPKWEWVRLTNTHYLTINITIEKIRVKTTCKETQSSVRNAAQDLWSLDMTDASFGIDGWMVNNTRITQIEMYPERCQIDLSEPPTLDADPASGVWFHEYSFIDPNGEPRPNGGVRWICAGPGLNAQELYNMSLPLIGRPDTAYSLFAFDEDGGEHQEFFMNLGGFPWHDNFRWHDPLNGLHGQWDWRGWDDDPAFDAEVTDVIAHEDGLSLDVKEQADIVNTYEGADSGLWSFTAWQYIPADFQSGAPGTNAGTHFLLLNTYEPGGPYHWSVQYNFDSNDGMLKIYYGNGWNTVNVPYETDRWVKLQCIVDLDTDWTQVYYDENLIAEYSWTGGIHGDGGGVLDIAAVDLWANGSSSVYYDDFVLEQLGELIVPCPADVNGDGIVDVVDLLELLSAWGGPGGPADINGDGIVDVQDLLELLSAWGPC